MKHGQAREFIDQALASDTDEHIEYPYCRNAKTGYGVLHGKCIHHIVCEEAHGPRPFGMTVRHSCKVKACVNPRHLSWGTPSQQQEDRVRDDTHTRGERHPLSKLTEDMVREIKARYAQGGVSQRKLAAEYGVSQGNIGLIVRGKKWAWVA